jgi:hypothetical protein
MFNLVKVSEGQIPHHTQEPLILSPSFTLIILLVIALSLVTIVFIIVKIKKSDSFFHRSCSDNNCLSNPSDSESQNLPEAELRDISYATGKESFKVKIPNTRIGRSLENDIIIPEKTVSTKHAIIEYRRGCYYLIDNQSSNGTFLNGSRIPSQITLKSGDLIAFDSFKFQFVILTLNDLKKTDYQQVNSTGTLLRPDRSHLKS